jgi:DNA-binding NarL/FixJ family response regulator
VPHTRLLLAAVPPILSDIIRDALADVHGVEVVRETAGEEDLAESVARSRADVLVTEDAGQELSDRHLGLMYRHPRLKLLTISPDGRRAALYRLMPRRRLLVDVSPDGLVAAIRGAVRPGGAEG